MTAAPKKTPYEKIIDGGPRPPYLTPELCREATSFKPTANDVILVSHPKSGTQWVSQIVLLLLNKGRSPEDLADLVRRAPCLEWQGVPASDDSPRFFRSHFPLGELRYEKEAKYIYVARNPWDTCVSFYYFVKGAPRFRFQDGTFEDFVDAFVQGRVGHANHLDHVLSGYNRRHEPNVLFLTYEKVKADTAGTVLQLAKFLGEPYVSMLKESSELMDDILFKSSIDYMKRKFEVSLDETYKIFKCPPPATEAESKSTLEKTAKYGVVGKGNVGDWIRHFTPELLKRTQIWIDDKTRGSDIMGLWESQSEAIKLASVSLSSIQD
ncbi:unnamed protein product [Ixodes hexagonus]